AELRRCARSRGVEFPNKIARDDVDVCSPEFPCCFEAQGITRADDGRSYKLRDPIVLGIENVYAELVPYRQTIVIVVSVDAAGQKLIEHHGIPIIWRQESAANRASKTRCAAYRTVDIPSLMFMGQTQRVPK